MEPFKALTFLASVGIVSLIGAGAAGFYAGYSAGRGNLDEIKEQVVNASTGGFSLKPLQEDIRSISKQVESLAAVKPVPAVDPAQITRPMLDEIKALSHQLDGWKTRSASSDDQNGKAVLEEIKALTHQVETLKVRPAAEPEQGVKPVLDEIKALARQVDALKVRPAAESEQSPKAVLEEIKSLSRQIEALKARPVADPEQSLKPLVDEIKLLARQIDALKAAQPARAPDAVTAAAAPANAPALESIREEIAALSTKLEKQEPKAPKALVDEIRALSASVQAQEPVARRAIAEELRSAVVTLQNSEPKVPKALMDEVRNISANVRPDPKPQASVADQIKVLSASIESLKLKLAENGGRERGDGGANVAAEIAQLQQLVAAASDQFGRCQTQLASLSSAGYAQAPQPAAPAATTVAMSQAGHQPAVVFYDNVMLKKDQEKQYDEIGVKLALQSVGPRQVKVAVNRQGFGLSFGERKVFRSQDVECELNLMETNLNEAQARVSISCKR